MAGEEEPRPLGASGARMLYNLADALYPELPRDLAPAAERILRHSGLGAIRRTRLALLWLEWEPLLALHARRRFWRLPLAERQAACARWRGSRFAFARRAWARLSAFVEDALENGKSGDVPLLLDSLEGGDRCGPANESRSKGTSPSLSR